MKRRNFIYALPLIASSLAIPRGSLAQSKSIRWRMALAVPKTLPIWGPLMERFGEIVSELTAGKFKIRVYGAGELVPALGTFEAVRKGEIQLGHAASYYWSGTVPAAAFFTSIPFGMSSEQTLAWVHDGGGQELYDNLMKPYGVKCLPCGSSGAQMMGWFRRPINSMADLKGLKIRIPGLAARVYSLAGASPTLIPAGELFTSLSTGVIDAVEWVGPYHDYILGLPRGASHYYGPGWQEPGAILELMINLEQWEKLPKEYQLALRVAADHVTLNMHSQFLRFNGEYLKKIRDEGKNKVEIVSREILQGLKDFSEKALEELIEGSPIAADIHKSYFKFIELTSSYQNLSHNILLSRTK